MDVENMILNLGMHLHLSCLQDEKFLHEIALTTDEVSFSALMLPHQRHNSLEALTLT